MATIEYDQSRVIGIEDGVLAWVDKDEKLMWEIKNIDNIEMMYVWHTSYLKNLPATGPDSVALGYESEIKDATSYVKRLNDSNYAGFNDWRLPKIEELEALIDHEGSHRKIKIPLQENTCAAYWSDTPSMVVNVYKVPGADIRDTAHFPSIKIVDFSNANTVGYKPGNSLWIRCVRSIENTPENT